VFFPRFEISFKRQKSQAFSWLATTCPLDQATPEFRSYEELIRRRRLIILLRPVRDKSIQIWQNSRLATLG
jgi:hypothetical protein